MGRKLSVFIVFSWVIIWSLSQAEQHDAIVFLLVSDSAE